jgi:hypothetical protein
LSRSIREDRDFAERQRALDDAKRALELKRRIPELEDHVFRYESDGERIRRVEAQLTSRIRPTREEMVRIRESFHALRERERDAERLDFRVRITAEDTLPVEIGVERIQLEARQSREVIAAEALELRLPGIARLEFHAPGGIERVKSQKDLEAARNVVRDLGLKFGAEDIDKLDALAREREDLEADLLRFTASRDALFKNAERAKSAKAELGAAGVTLAELKERHPEWKGEVPDAATLTPIEQGLIADRRQLEDVQKTREALLESRRESAERTASDLSKEEELLRTLKTKDHVCESRIRQHESDGMTDELRSGKVRELEKQSSETEAAIDELDRLLESFGDPQLTIDRLTQERRQRENARQQAHKRKIELGTMLEQIRARGLWEELGNVSRDLDAKYEDLEREKLAADALKLLRDVLMREQAAAVDAAVRPVADRVSRMARFLFGPSSKATFGERLAPQALTADGCELAVDLLSAGTQDQLALLTRIALGELFAEKNGRHVFVLDDPLVNSDRERRGKLLEILTRATRDLQIVIFTCSPEIYRGLPEEKTVFISVEDAKARIRSTATMTA